MGGGAKARTIFAPKARTFKSSTFAFITEVFAFRHTISARILPQLTLALIMGFVANSAKIRFCESEHGQIEDASQCWIAFDDSAHLSAGIILGLLLVFRTSLAYDRYYDGKAALGQIYNGIRNLNVAVVAFMRLPREDEENYSPNSIDARRAQLSKDRVNILRLSNIMFAFMRQATREHRHGYSDTGPVEDEELLTKDRAGKPSLPSLWNSGAERVRYSRIDFNNRANVVAAEICYIAESHRRMGHISERACLDIYHELELELAAFKEIERIVTTPIPYQYLHMINVILFTYIFTTPFVFTVSFKHATPIASFMIALGYYGVNAIGRCMEDPFNWDEPNHDLTSIGWRMSKENMKLHEMADVMEKDMMLQALPKQGEAGRAKQVFKMAGALRAAAAKESVGRGMPAAAGGNAILAAVAQMNAQNEADDEEEDDDPVEVAVGQQFGEGRFAFFTELWAWDNTVWPSLLPQVILAALVGGAAQFAKTRLCEDGGDEVYEAEDCLICFDKHAHDLVGMAIGFLMVFRVNMSYERYYEGKEVVGNLYEGIRNLNVAFAAFMRVPEPGELDYKAEVTDEYRQALSEDRLEVFRLSNLLYAFIRQAVREQRKGYPGVGPVSDEEIVTRDRRGKPSVPLLMRDEERYEYLAFGAKNRPNILVARIQSIVEHHRRVGHICERAAFEMYHQSEEVLSAYRAAERIVMTPIPYIYLHAVQFLLFFFIFSSGFMFSYTFKWITPLPCVILSMGFYGLNEIGRALQDPFSWEEPMHDLSSIGWRVYRENLALHQWIDGLEKSGKRANSARNTRLYEVLTNAMESHDADQGGDGAAESASVPKRSRRASVSNTERSADERRRPSLIAARLDVPIITDEAAHSLSFVTAVFKWKHTVLQKLVPHMVLATVLALLAHFLKLQVCDKDAKYDTDCWITLSSSAHKVIVGVIAFLLVFRTNIAYYRYYEGKKFLGALLNAVRNVNVAVVSFVRAPREGEYGYESRKRVREELQRALSRDRIELRRLSNVLFAFIRQAIREQRNGYPDEQEVTDDELIRNDKMGKPSLAHLLTEDEKALYTSIDFNNRPNVVVAEMQTIIEKHRRLGNVSERGAFDVYHDLEGALVAFKNCERIVSTKMPYQYMHMLNFLLFLFAFTTPLVYSANYQWLVPLPVLITVIAFYGIAEIGYAIEEPFDWNEPSHDMTVAGLRSYHETLQVHEVGDTAPRTEPVLGDFDVAIANASNAQAPTGESAKTHLLKTQLSRGSFSMASGDDLLNMYSDVPVDINHSTLGFIVELFSIRHTVWSRVIGQVIAAGIVGMLAQLAKIHVCGDDVKTTTDCDVTFEPEAHGVVGAVLGFMLVFRTNLAYERFYEGKQSVGQLHIALRNLNIGVIAFVRPPTKGEAAYEEGPARSRLAQELREKRSEMLRLTHILYAFMRQAVREQHIGYPQDLHVTDSELLTNDKYGKPSLSSLLTPAEVSFFGKVPFHNRPNVVVTMLQKEVELVRRMPNVLCDRGAFDLYSECELVLDAFKSCERVVSTPIPYQYLHMVNFVTFCFAFSVPFTFSYSWKWLTPAPAMALALTYYGIGKIGESIERPFDWTVPNHDMTGLGWRIYRECTQLHKRFNKREETELKASDSAQALRPVELEWTAATARVGKVGSTRAGMDLAHGRRASLAAQGVDIDMVYLTPWPLHNYTFLTELFTKQDTVISKIVPQMAAGGIVGLFAQYVKMAFCGDDVETDRECWIAFGNEAHTIAGSILGFLLVFRVNLAYTKFYEAKEALGLVYDGLRNVMVAISSFMRESSKAERGFREHTPAQLAQLRLDLIELLRLTNLLFAFIRQAVREQRHGYPRKPFVSDLDLLDADKFGSPCVPDLLTPQERAFFKNVDFNNPPNLVMAKIQMLVERNRRLGFIYDKSAFDVYHECETVLGAFKICEKITTTPVPYQYLHMLNFLLFFFVYTSPFVFSASFKYMTPLPAAIVAMGFYGIAEIGNVIEESFDWKEPSHDLTGLGRRIMKENKLILGIRDVPANTVAKAARAAAGGPVTEAFSPTAAAALGASHAADAVIEIGDGLEIEPAC